jgi:hypothetical protein
MIDEFVSKLLVIPLAMMVLGVCIQIRGSRRERDGADSRTRQGDFGWLRERRISSVNQESDLHEERAFGIRGIPSQLRYAFTIRRSGNAGCHDCSGFQVDHEKHEISS